MKKTKIAGCLVVALAVFLVLSLVLNVFLGVAAVGGAMLAGGAPLDSPYFETTVDNPTGDFGGSKIARIDVRGVISSYGVSDPLGFSTSEDMVTSTTRRLKQASDDETVKAILVYVDSPGGEVTASDTIYNAVKAANEQKPVLVYMGSMATSGGYYIACGADEIIANETTLTGSIGVIIQTMGYHEALEKVGLESRTFTSGDFKDSLNGGRPMRPEEKAYVNELVSEMYEKFAGIVSESREIPLARLKDGIADGRVLTGSQALEVGLIDSTGYVEDAYARAREIIGEPEAEVIRYSSPGGFFDLVAMKAKGAATPPEIKINLLPEGLLMGLQPGRVYLLPPHLLP